MRKVIDATKKGETLSEPPGQSDLFTNRFDVFSSPAQTSPRLFHPLALDPDPALLVGRTAIYANENLFPDRCVSSRRHGPARRAAPADGPGNFLAI